jgi:hypothetical protein
LSPTASVVPHNHAAVCHQFGQFKDRIEQVDQANFVTGFPKNLAVGKIDPSANANFCGYDYLDRVREIGSQFAALNRLHVTCLSLDATIVAQLSQLSFTPSSLQQFIAVRKKNYS